MSLDAENTRVKRVLFVCTANICRSPTAEAIFDALVTETGAQYEAGSAGTAALVNEPIALYARAALDEIGVFAEGHRARQVNQTMLEDADLVLAMTPKQADTLRRLSEPLSAKVHTLLEYANDAPDMEGIPDPYGQSMTAHRASVRQLYHHLSVLVERLDGGDKGSSNHRSSRV